VGDWLYGVAYRTALKARCAAAKRRAQEARIARTEAVPAAMPDDWRAVLDQELQRLPEKYRRAVLLCDLEGKTRKEAARQLGWADGTLSTRLTRARTMLLGRLSRRGVALSLAALAAGLAQSSLAACVPPRLIAATVQGQKVVAFTATAGAIPVQVAVLMEGVMKSMVLIKLKKCLVIVLVAAGMLGLGLGAYRALQAEETTQGSDAKPPAQDNRTVEASPQVDFWKRSVCHLSVPECIALALENSASIFDGSWQDWDSLGLPDLTVLSRLNGRSTVFPVQRVFAFDPAIGGISGICLVRLTSDLPRAEFQRMANALLLNTECAYWKLYQAYGYLYTYEELLRQAHKAWSLARDSRTAGGLGPQELCPVRAQYEEFRSERLKAIVGVYEAERNLRGIMDLPPEDGKRLVPVTAPTLTRYTPNWQAAEEDALTLRPELILAREKVKNAQANLDIYKNVMSPDLRLVGQYTPLSPGTTLDGRGTVADGLHVGSNAFASLAGGSLNTRTEPVPLKVPGYRPESAALRSARLGLAQAYYHLEDQEQRAQRTLTKHYQKLGEWHHRMEIVSAEREGFADSVKSCWELYRVHGSKGGEKTLGSLVLSLLQYQRSMALAQLKEYEAIAEYNNTLGRFDWARGKSTSRHNVTIREGLPKEAQVRAAEVEQRRTRALLRKLGPSPLTQPGILAGPKDLPALKVD
jgi:hypothetical protein